MKIFRVSKDSEDKDMINRALTDEDSNQGLFHGTSPVLPLVHWMELHLFLYTTQYFKYLNLNILRAAKTLHLFH
jgi:hypothetical protein